MADNSGTSERKSAASGSLGEKLVPTISLRAGARLTEREHRHRLAFLRQEEVLLNRQKKLCRQWVATVGVERTREGITRSRQLARSRPPDSWSAISLRAVADEMERVVKAIETRRSRRGIRASGLAKKT